jgi:coiled-coil domain-containing protein 151
MNCKSNVSTPGDASHAKETALSEKDRVLAAYEDERKRREKDLREKHQVVQLRKQMLERMRHRDQMRSQLMTNDGKLSDGSMTTQNQRMVEKMDARNRVDVFEQAFRRIKEATGVSDVNEVIQKIVSQESSMENLVALTKENQAKIETLNETRRTIKVKVDELKYSGVGGGHRRKLVDDHEDQLANSTARLERSRLKYERLSKIIISMKSGVGHLQEKLEPSRDELGGRAVELTDDTVAEVLRECELLLANIMRRVEASGEVSRKGRFGSIANIKNPFTMSMSAGIGIGAGAAGSGDADQLESEEAKKAAGISIDLDHTLRPFNQRIDLSLDDEEGGVGVGWREDEGVAALGDDDEELTREKVKRASNQILSQIDRKMRSRAKKKGSGPNDFLDD